MTIAVTAASGQLGRHIVQALLAATEEPVIGLARTPSNAQGLGIEIRPGNYSEPEVLKQSLVGVDTVLLVSGMDAPDKRIQQHRNVIEAARENGASKIVYTSIQGVEEGTAFSPIVASNRQTERDVRESGLDWVIGRNGIYIEPDVEYMDAYRAAGRITNCAADGKCGYTTRPELGFAYAQMLTHSEHNGRTYKLHGQPITQAELTGYLNSAFGTDLTYEPISVAEYRDERTAELGDFLGPIIAGIYEGIRLGALDVESDYEIAAGRAHQAWDDYFGSMGQ